MIKVDCFECGNKALFVDIDYPFNPYCGNCIRDMYSPKEENK